MMLVLLIVIPAAAGLLCWLCSGLRGQWTRWISFVAMVAELAVAIDLWIMHPALKLVGGPWLVVYSVPWIPQWGIDFRLAMDGLSLLMILLTALLGALSVAVSWESIKERVAFFHLNLCLVTAGIVGVFLAEDLFLFYLFWELMLIPMYFVIAIWGHENKRFAAIKFVIFTQSGALLMLLAILALYFIHGAATGDYTFNYFKLLGTTMSAPLEMTLMLGFFVAFAIKLPAFPVHTWLPDAHTQAPTAGSVILAGLLLKTGAYGLIRFVVPLFPDAAMRFAPIAMILGVAGIIHGAALAFAQDDLKRLVAYTSISHLGFVLIGVFAWTTLALQGTVLQMIAHGLSTGALFIIAGSIQDRIHSRDMRQMGGFWSIAPRLGGMTMFFALASLGLPGMANFVGELMIFLGSFKQFPVYVIIAAGGLILATVYSLWIVFRAFHGEPPAQLHLKDLGAREVGILSVLAALLLWIGLFPQTVLNTAAPSIGGLRGGQSAVTAPASPDAVGPSRGATALRESGGPPGARPQSTHLRDADVLVLGDPPATGMNDDNQELYR
jgi:NADH-quinone oxidoreductase subunit M